MALNYVIDTNVALYFLTGRMVSPMPAGNLLLCVVSEIELLSFKNLSIDEENSIKQFIKEVTVLGITNPIKSETIRVRKEFGLRLPDAIIAATALVHHASLLSHDKQFSKVKGLQLVAPTLK